MIMNQLDQVWNEAKAIIKTALANDDNVIVYEEFFKDTTLVQLGDQEAIILVNLRFHSIFLNDNDHLKLINGALSSVTGREIRSRVMFVDDYYEMKKDTANEDDYLPNIYDNVMPDYTFENFVLGPSNKEAYASALAVANNPGRNLYNPLFIYGDSGLGKTHLLFAIGNYVKQRYPEKKILYISSSDFFNQVWQASKNKTLDLLKNQFNSLDVLMVDDIQLLSNKKTSNDVFFDIYNGLFNNRKQIILTSDRLPSQIKDVEERLISRFQQGLSVNITAPEFETALEILKMKMKTHNIAESDIEPEALEFLATNFSSDIRTLEGSLNRLLFYHINFNQGNKIDLNITMEAFKDIMSNNPVASRKTVDTKDIIIATADYYGLTKQQITGKSRTKNVSTARHIAMYLCRKHLEVSFDKIGEEFGGKDHATVMSGCTKIEKMVMTDESYKRAVSDIEKKLFTR